MRCGVSLPRDPPKKDHPGTLSLGKELLELCLCNRPRRGMDPGHAADLQGSGKGDHADLVQEGHD